jgi:hypothetical protein
MNALHSCCGLCATLPALTKGMRLTQNQAHACDTALPKPDQQRGGINAVDKPLPHQLPFPIQIGNQLTLR